MAAATISSEKIDLLIYGPHKPIVDNGFSDQFVLHKFETSGDLERLSPAVAEKIRGAAVTYNTVRGDSATLAKFPKLEIVSSFGVGYDHIDANYARDHNIVVTNTPDVLTEEVADIAMGLLICTLREFIKADRYLRSGLWMTQQFPLSVGSLRDRKVGMVGMGRIGQAIGRRLDASRVPVVYHSRNPAPGVSYKHYPDLIEMAKAVDTLVIIIPGGAATANMINADGMVIQKAGEKALAAGVGMRQVLEMVQQFRRANTVTPIVLMGYANPVEAYDIKHGPDSFIRHAAAAGVDGMLIVDYPPEECVQFAQKLRAHNMDLIFLLAPTSTDTRMRQVAEVASGYVYYVSLKGVTGAGTLDIGAVEAMLPRIRQHVSIPVGVGFGIRDAATAQAISRVADAVVIGSRIIQLIEHQPRDQVAATAQTFLAEIRAALD